MVGGFRFFVELSSSGSRTDAHWDSAPRKIPTTTLVRQPAFVFSEVPAGRHIVAHRETVGTRDAEGKSPGGAAQLLGQVCRPSGAFSDLACVPTTSVVGYDMSSLRDSFGGGQLEWYYPAMSSPQREKAAERPTRQED